MNGLVIAADIGVAVGSLVGWEAGRRWERAAWAWSWTSSWLAEAVWLARDAAGWIITVVLILVASGVVVWVAY